MDATDEPIEYFPDTKEILLEHIIFDDRYINPRDPDDLKPDDLKELADSIEVTNGVIHPVTVLMHTMQGDAQLYVLIAGERRYRASQMAKRATVCARIIYRATDAQIRDLQLIENGQRKNIHPLDEAAAFARSRRDVADISHATGYSLRHVYDRLHLLYLNESARKLFRNGTFAISQALLLSKLTSENQDIILDQFLITAGRGKDKQILGVNSTQKLKYLISRYGSVKLAGAIFDPSDRKLYRKAGACDKCEKRSGFNRTLFHDVTDDDMCFDTACYNTKCALRCGQIESDIHAQGFDVIRLTGMYDESEIAKTYELNADYGMEVGPAEPSPVSKTFGIYYEHPIRAKVGDVVTILPVRAAAPPPKKGKRSALDEIKTQKAITAFKNVMINKIGERIGEFDCTSFPLPFLKLIGFWLLDSMSKELKTDVYRFYKWDIVPRGTDVYIKNTASWTIEQMIQFILNVVLYDTMRSDKPVRLEYFYISELASLWKIDMMKILSDIEGQFEIKLDGFKSLIA
jgi:ParB/RepB/Spo0J family partition protein